MNGETESEPHGCTDCRAVVLKLAPGETYECEGCGTDWSRPTADKGPLPTELL